MQDTGDEIGARQRDAIRWPSSSDKVAASSPQLATADRSRSLRRFQRMHQQYWQGNSSSAFQTCQIEAKGLNSGGGPAPHTYMP
jgi:hypothetical protein